MKELSIEEKAKAYDEALKVLHKYDGANIMFSQSLKEEMFPELKESEDEKIRKGLIKALEMCKWCGDKYWSSDLISIDDALAWLEKQGKKKSYSSETMNEKGDFDSGFTRMMEKEQKPIKEHNACEFCEDRYGCVSPCSMKLVEEQKPNPVLDIEIPFGAKDSELQEASYYIPEGFHAEIEGNRIVIKRGKQKSADKVEPKFKVGQTIKKKGFNLGFTIVKIKDGFYYNDLGDYFPFTDQDNWELVEQKSWSEEDEINLGHIIRIIGRLYDKQEKNYLKESLEGKINWLKSLKDRVQPQQEWTEDDRIRIANCIQLIGKTGDGEVEWLKALESRILPQTKQEWTEEDKKMRAAILQLITDSEKENGWNCVYCNDKEIYFSDIIAWLKFFIPQSHWKPTDEQISLLEELVEDNNQRYFYNILRTLYEQLKKLREE